jgi:hypothetical protein
LSVMSNYHILELRVRLQGGTEPYCIQGQCHLPGGWFRPKLNPGHRGTTLAFSTSASCPLVSVWAHLERPAGSKVPNSALKRSAQLRLCV